MKYRLLVSTLGLCAILAPAHPAETHEERGKRVVYEALEALGGDEPTPALAAQLSEEFQRLMQQLGDSSLRMVATWKLEGYTDQEIGARLGCVTRTVERKLARIRGIWAKEMSG